MKFYISTAYLDTREIIDIACAAEDLGYAGVGIPDHVVNLETLATPYPYTRDGRRRWEPFTDWPDPWVLIGALSRITSRIHFITTVYVAALRDPYSAAKSIGTAAVLADGRIELGLGVGWCAEEFELMNARFAGRGKRSEEMVELMRSLWSPGWTEFTGQRYSTPRLEMTPVPPPVPIWFGGLSDIALRRAARYDGWVGDLMTTEEAIRTAATLHRYRAEIGLADAPFSILAPLTDAFGPDQYAAAEAAGVTHVLTMPWMFYAGPDADLEHKIDGMRRFRQEHYPQAFDIPIR